MGIGELIQGNVPVEVGKKEERKAFWMDHDERQEGKNDFTWYNIIYLTNCTMNEIVKKAGGDRSLPALVDQLSSSFCWPW